MPAQIVADGSVRKRFQRATALEPDYLLVLLPTDDPSAYGVLRIKRRIIDRYRTRGAIVRSLKRALAKQFGVDGDEFKRIALRGGEVKLLRKQS